jgi:hypothetical protein
MYGQDDIQNKIQKLQEQYYSKNTKNYFIKKKQKQDCAAHVTQHIDIALLLEKTFSIKDHGIYFEYQILKTFTNPSNYEQIVSYMIDLAKICIQTHETFDLHINLRSFSITAAQRNSEIIQLFCSRCLQADSIFYNHLSKLYLHNCPGIIQTLYSLFGGFADKDAKNKVVIM